jgi:hypothetical protein
MFRSCLSIVAALFGPVLFACDITLPVYYEP